MTQLEISEINLLLKSLDLARKTEVLEDMTMGLMTSLICKGDEKALAKIREEDEKYKKEHEKENVMEDDYILLKAKLVKIKRELQQTVISPIDINEGRVVTGTVSNS